MTRPKIVHVITHLMMGGLENGLVNLINGLDERFQHAVVCLVRSSEFADRIQRDDVDIVELHKRPGKDLAVYGRLFRAFRALKPTVVHTRNIGTIDAGVVARASGVKHVIHGEHGFDMVDLHGRHARYRQLRRWANPFIRRFVCVSDQIRVWLENDIGLPAAKLNQIYNGVDVDKFQPAARATARDALTQLGVTQPFVVGTVGRLEEVKNQRELIAAFARQSARDPAFCKAAGLVLIGDGSRRKDLEQQAHAQGCERAVHFFGARDDVAALLPGLDVFVLPSLNEGVSNTLLEAMACGVPVVASRVGGNPELFVDPTHGVLYDSGDDAALANALGRFAHDSNYRGDCATRARRHVAEHFSLAGMVERYGDLYASYC